MSRLVCMSARAGRLVAIAGALLAGPTAVAQHPATAVGAGAATPAAVSPSPAYPVASALPASGVLAAANAPAESPDGAPQSLDSIRSRPVSYAAAQGPSVEQYQELLRRLQAQEKALQELQQQQTVTIERLPSVQELNQRVSGLEAAAAAARNKFPQVRLSGFFQEDTGFFSQDHESIATLGHIQNGTGFRRARLQGLGNVTEFTSFSIEMDFAFAGRPSFMDVWLQQGNLPVVGNARLGQYRQPVTMDSWTNVRHLEFLERSAPFNAFDPFRRVGIMATDVSESQRTMWAGGIYATGYTYWNGVTGTSPAGSSTVYSTTGIDDRFGTTLGNGLSGALRASHLLHYDDPADGRYLLHVGGGYNYSQIGGSGTRGTDAQSFEAASIPEFYVGDPAGFPSVAAGTPNVVDTGRFLAKHYQLVHAELAGSYGSAHFQAEVMGDFVAQMNSSQSVNYSGAYVQAGYFLTGEAVGYNKLLGAMDYNVKPHTQFFGLGRNAGFGGFGAWEAAFRWSYLNLSSDKIVAANQLSTAGTPGSGSTLGVNPGILNEYTGALNWWWNEYTRLQFNLIRSDVQSNRTGFNALTIAAIRFQVEF